MRTAFLAVALTCPAVVSAQVAEFGVHGGVSRLADNVIGQLFLADQFGQPVAADVQLNDGWRFGFRLTLNNWRFMGHEFGYAYNRSRLEFPGFSAGMAIHQGFYNFLVYAVPEGGRVRPFVTGGGHFSNFVPPGVSATQGGGDTKFGFNYGGGVKVRVTDTWLFRVDYRDYVTSKPFENIGVARTSGALRQTEISAGVSFTL